VVSDQTLTHRALAAESRVALLGWVRASGPATVAEAAAAVGLHTNTARVHLERLVKVGLLARGQAARSGPGRPRALYLAPPEQSPVRPGPGPAEDASYKELAAVLVDELASRPDARSLAVEAGERWAAFAVRHGWPPDRAEVAPVAAVAQLLDDLGFAPEARSDGTAIDLHHCPFEDVARENRTVVCGVHQGLIAAAFAQVGGAVTLRALEPFREDAPLRCVARLGRAAQPISDGEASER
jgi:predicted ArsR family transcriptional regulator